MINKHLSATIIAGKLNTSVAFGNQFEKQLIAFVTSDEFVLPIFVSHASDIG